MAAITIVGVGPGDPDLLTLKARDVIRSADYVAGFETVLGPVRRWISGEAMPMRYRDQEECWSNWRRMRKPESDAWCARGAT